VHVDSEMNRVILQSADHLQAGAITDVGKTRLDRAREILREALLTRAGVTFGRLFAFPATRCDRVVGAVMQKIGV